MLRSMKYESDQQGIMKRYINESDGWKAHIENSRNTIIKYAENKGRKNCAILGSGWLLDVPIEFLSQNFEKVYLFDILHPNQIKHKAKQLKNVVCVNLDVTGDVVHECFNAIQYFKSVKKAYPLENIEIKGFTYHVEFDYIVSVNILNQLDILMIDYLKPYNIYSDEELSKFRCRIQQQHFDSLPIGKSCLITDIEEHVLSFDNKPEDIKNLIFIELPTDKLKDSWDWNFDSHQNYIPGKNVVFKVQAYEL